jgi:hypothetical protein
MAPASVVPGALSKVTGELVRLAVGEVISGE